MKIRKNRTAVSKRHTKRKKTRKQRKITRSSKQKGGNSEELIDIVIPYHSKDYKILPYTIKGLEYIANKGKVYLISNEDPKIENTIYIDEKIFPFTKDNIVEYIGVENASRAGWYLQQLLKLYAFKLIPNLSENFLIVDSETVFINPVTFVKDSKLCFATSAENHYPYYEHIACLFKGALLRQTADKSGIVHHMIFTKRYLQELFDKIQEINATEVWKAMMSCVKKEYGAYSGMSEYEIYFQYMLQYHKEVTEIRDLRWDVFSDIPNSDKYKTVNDVLNSSKDSYDFITLHVHTIVNRFELNGKK